MSGRGRYERLPWWLAPSASLVLFACGEGVDPLSILRGTVSAELSAEGYVEVQARVGSVLAATAPLVESAFVLALPAPATYQLHFADSAANDRPLVGPDEAVLDIPLCAGEGLRDLGEVSGGLLRCMPVACSLATQLLETCMNMSGELCGTLQVDLQDCIGRRDPACQPLFDALTRCRELLPPNDCSREQTEYQSCSDQYACEAFEQRLQEACTDPCLQELQQVSALCPTSCPTWLVPMLRVGSTDPAASGDCTALEGKNLDAR